MYVSEQELHSSRDFSLWKRREGSSKGALPKDRTLRGVASLLLNKLAGALSFTRLRRPGTFWINQCIGIQQVSPDPIPLVSVQS